MLDPFPQVMEVREGTHGGLGVFGLRPITAREVLGSLCGEPLAAPTRYSIHFDGIHYDVGPPIRFMNHSCAPNSRWEGKLLVALRDIAPGEEIFFDYLETEDVISAPFVCRCGAPGCRGIIGHLPPPN